MDDGYRTCVYCGFTAKARKDGTMRKHRVAKDVGTGSTGSHPQDPYGPICRGSGEEMPHYTVSEDGVIQVH